MQQNIPLTRDLVLVGGGHTHALVLRMWGMNPLPGVRVTVINPGPTAPYSGMLPGFVAGHYTRDDLDIDLVKLARFAGARIIIGKAEAIDTDARTVTVAGRTPVGYDVLSIDVGITSAMPDLQGFAEHGVPAKPLETFATRWSHYRDEAEKPAIAVIGGGVAGAELAMAMAFAMRQRGKKAEVRLIDRGRVLDQFNDDARKLLLKSLRDMGVLVLENVKIAKVTEKAVVMEGGNELPSTFTVGAAGARPHAWLADAGLSTYDGYISVGPALQSSDQHVFAAGDCAYLSHDPRPKAGVFAVRAAPVLFRNLRAALSGDTMGAFHPQKDYLKLVSLGGKSALAEKFGTARRGAFLWKWKDRIDRTFMDKFRQLPVMKSAALPNPVAEGVAEVLGDTPLCGGCGAKVGRGALRDALVALPPIDRPDIRSTRGDDAGVITIAGQRQVMTTDHLRAFTEDPVLMTRVAAMHALGDVWAMGARPQAATVSVILPRMSEALQRRTMTEVTEAAAGVMERAGAVIVGGHSSIGSEFTIGFTVTGLCDLPEVSIDRAKVGDVLILTQPIGAGVIMAAEMRGLAKGADVVNAFEKMLQPQTVSSRVLAQVAHAMTDVTGFGLAGHLAGICEASGVGAEIDLAKVPVLQGAEALSKAGVRSSLWKDNRAGCGPVFGAEGPKADLLFDPQTAGGLLAAVRADIAEETQRKLWMCGYQAAIIGRITEGEAIKVL